VLLPSNASYSLERWQGARDFEGGFAPFVVFSSIFSSVVRPAFCLGLSVGQLEAMDGIFVVQSKVGPE